jgi:hypothetical protein
MKRVGTVLQNLLRFVAQYVEIWCVFAVTTMRDSYVNPTVPDYSRLA